MRNTFLLASLICILLTGCTVLPTPKTQNSFKIADNNTPQTQDRLYFDFKYFDAVPTSRCIGPLSVQRQAADGSAKTTGDTIVTLPSEGVYDTADCSHAAQQVTIPDGKNSVDFFFRTQQPGEYTFTGANDGYTPAEAIVTVQANTLNVDGTFLVDKTDNTSDVQVSIILNDAESATNNICGFQFDLSAVTPALPTPTDASISLDDGTNDYDSDWVCSVTDFLLTCSGTDTVKAGTITTTDIFIDGDVPSVTSVPVTLLGPQPGVTIPIAIRSYGMCADGSCGERFATVTGTFK